MKMNNNPVKEGLHGNHDNNTSSTTTTGKAKKPQYSKDYCDKVLVYAETKRIAENLTKKEMCHIIGLNDNYYIGCVAGRAIPSARMIDALNSYLNMDTKDVYFKVFAFRSTPAFVGNKNSDRFMVVNGMFKEKYHESMNANEEQYVQIVEQLKEDYVLQLPM